MAMKDSEIELKLTLDTVKDKRLSSTAVLLYGIICGLSSKGYCFATNAYFQNILDLSDRQIRDLLKQLKQSGYIQVQLHTNDHVSDRRIVPIGSMPVRRSADYDKRGGTEGRTYEPRPYVDKRLYFDPSEFDMSS